MKKFLMNSDNDDILNSNDYQDIIMDDCSLVRDRDKDGNIIAKITISSFIGVCANAKHYYGRITINESQYINNTGILKGCYEYSDESRKLIDRFKNKCHKIELDIVRELTQDDLDEYGDNKYGYHVGDMTTAFTNLNELKKFIKEVIKEVFIGKWKFVLEDLTWNEININELL